MKFINLGSISKKLALLVLLAVLPALVILFYSGIEQRRYSIERAKQDVLLLAHTMAHAQKDITNSTRQILSTLSQLPAIQDMDEPWKERGDEVKYVPLQPREGDLAVYLQKSGYEIEFNNEKYVIIPHSAILMLIRDKDLFK